MTKTKVSKKRTRVSDGPQQVDTKVLMELRHDIDVLTSNIDRIDKRVVLISDGLSFMADNCRQLFGLAGLAVVIDAITAKFK